MERSRIALNFVLFAGGLLTLAAPAEAAPTNQLNLLVPAYFYPEGQGLTDWNRLTTAAATVSVTAIVNPENGPGAASDAAFVSAIGNLRTAGGSVAGYVYTGYGTRPLVDVQADLAKYTTFNYDLNGVFFDEVASDPTPANLAYYASLYTLIKTAHPTWRVFANPGTATAEAFINGSLGRTADTFVVSEGAHADYDDIDVSAWNANYARDNFAHLIHAAGNRNAMTADIDRAAALNAGYVYVTNDVLPNPWDTLPSYWSREITKLETTVVPEPGFGLAVGTGTLFLLRRRRDSEIATNKTR